MRDPTSHVPSALIAEDEPNLAAYLRERLAAAWPELNVVGVAGDGPEALRLIEEHDPDVLFLDIRMPGLNGLEVARRAAEGVQVVFVTAYDQYAVQAFEQEAVDYLLKPVTDERLAQTVRRVRERLRTPPAGNDVKRALDALARVLPSLSGRASPGRLAWIRASVGNQIRLIAIEEICYFQANDKYTSVFTVEGEALIRTSLKELAEQLDPDRFWQIHRGTIVNLAAVASTTRDLAGRMQLRLKGRPETLAVSRAFAHRFRQM
ncbi:MAG TPA: LytTR family DNA-binding domain-containing protein [Casimicrobiaceae bacterium]|nr:LytTR family DNA-binding domain-containing protein [Casimicrobiaceae bacterium]